jgi:hypothetical protein
MALLDLPLTDKEVRSLVTAMGWPVIHYSPILQIASEPKYDYVRYDAALGRVVYEARDTFYWTTSESPSDSRWMVPGVRR